MNTIKITVMAKREFSEHYEIREYRKHASEQLVVRKYAMGISKLVVDEER